MLNKIPQISSKELGIIWQMKIKECRQQDLCKKFNESKYKISRTIKKLRDTGLVYKEENIRDPLRLTKFGEHIAKIFKLR